MIISRFLVAAVLAYSLAQTAGAKSPSTKGRLEIAAAHCGLTHAIIRPFRYKIDDARYGKVPPNGLYQIYLGSADQGVEPVMQLRCLYAKALRMKARVIPIVYPVS